MGINRNECLVVVWVRLQGFSLKVSAACSWLQETFVVSHLFLFNFVTVSAVIKRQNAPKSTNQSRKYNSCTLCLCNFFLQHAVKPWDNSTEEGVFSGTLVKKKTLTPDKSRHPCDNITPHPFARPLLQSSLLTLQNEDKLRLCYKTRVFP